MMQRVFIFVVILFTFSACASTIEVPPDTGIEGQALLGPMCPVVREDQPCPDVGYQATMTVLTETGRTVTQFQTDEEGYFRIALPPGSYILHPESPKDKPLPYAGEMLFTVSEGAYTLLTVNYDSGIR